MSINLLDGTSFHIGESDKLFSIQSISKVFSFTQALNIYSHDLYNRVGKEPSGNRFNSMIQLEYEDGKPRNPFINAGAIVICDTLLSNYKTQENTSNNMIDFIKKISNDNTINFDNEVFLSEIDNGYRNAALCNLMKDYNNIKNDVDDVIKTYFKQCSIKMNTKTLSRSMLYLANHGIDPISGKMIIDLRKAKRINAMMLTCGHYDASGDFAFEVGLPGKSGVGGGIVAVVPNVLSISVYSPRLNSWGNSLAGTEALKLFTTKTGLSIF